MKIISLTAENVKKLRAVEITPTGEIVTIAGKNDAGKSTVLDSIWWLLAGKANVQSQPIRRGETTARIMAKLGGDEIELIVERTFKSKGEKEWTSSLRVMKPNGDVPRGGPQEILDALLGDLSFDPFAFARMKSDAQFEELRRVSHLDVDIVELDELNATDYATRTDVNRAAKAKRAQAAAIVVAVDLPTAPIDEDALLDEFEQAAEQNTRIEQRKAKRLDVARHIATARDNAEKARKAANAARAEAARLDESAKAQDAEANALQRGLDDAAPLPEPIDVALIRRKLDDARAMNAAISSRARRAAIEADAEALEKQSADLTENIQTREEAKRNAITSAQLPVPGLGFGEGIVTFEGVPFDQVGTATQTRVSVGIAMVANPKLRVILIKDGSLLDESTLAQIEEMAKGNDYQVWLERVETDGEIGIIIEDGSVRAK